MAATTSVITYGSLAAALHFAQPHEFWWIAAAKSFKSASMDPALSLKHNCMRQTCKMFHVMQALASNNLEKVASTMEQFERQFENLDVQSQFVEGAMNNQANLSTPEEDVNMLMQQVSLTVDMLLPQVPLSCSHPGF